MRCREQGQRRHLARDSSLMQSLSMLPQFRAIAGLSYLRRTPLLIYVRHSQEVKGCTLKDDVCDSATQMALDSDISGPANARCYRHTRKGYRQT